MIRSGSVGLIHLDYEEVPIETNKGKISDMKHLEYKGYSGSIEYSKEDGVFYGKVLGIRSLISYEGMTGPE